MLKPNQITFLLGYRTGEKGAYIGNETYIDLISSTEIKREHLGVAYSYLYLTQWLYRYCKHFSSGFTIDNTMIKQILGYSARNQTFNYLIKKNGVLDSLGFTETTRDTPIAWKLRENRYGSMILDFTMLSSIEEINIPLMHNRYFIKKPMSLFYRRRVGTPIKQTINQNLKNQNLKNQNPINQNLKNQNPINQKLKNQSWHLIKQNLTNVKQETKNQSQHIVKGIAYDIGSTHYIPFNTFIYCMSNEEIGATGFYIYSYLKYMNDRFETGYDVSLESLVEKTGIHRRTLARYMDALKAYNLVSVQLNQDFYVPNRKKEDRKSNTYYTNERFQFSNHRREYPKMRAKSEEHYNEYLEIKKRIEAEHHF